MTRIKICGITSRADAEWAAACGADALGFIGVEGSPRYVSPTRFQEMAVPCPCFVSTVLVVRGRSDVPEGCQHDYVQYYEEPEGKGSLPSARRAIRAFRMKDAASLDEIAAFRLPVAAILLDTFHADTLGGSGETFNWALAAEAKTLTNRPIILAGGLSPENIADALDAVRPFAVDVSSGVEASPGVKDPDKVRAFIRAVRQWDARHGG